jgi:hypothetical protein
LRKLFSEQTTELNLRSRWHTLLFLLCIAVPVILLSYWASRWAYAQKLAESDNLVEVQKAVALDASNPRVYDKLGLICLFSMNEARPSEAARHLTQAIALAPRRAGYWVDLASACDWKADLDCSDRSLIRAIELSPETPRLEWIAANHYVRTNRPALSISHLRRLLAMSTDYALPVFGLCTRAFADPEIIRREILPGTQDPSLQLSLMDFLSAHGWFDSADRVWPAIATERVSFAFALIQPYLQRSLDAGRISQAQRVWEDLEQLKIIAGAAENNSDNLVYNGGYEQDTLNAVFDWRFQELPYLATDFHDSSAAQGRRCLRIDFTVPRNDDVEPIFQLIPVRPNTTYTLTAQVRLSSITSDSGPRLRLTDPACPACLDTQSQGSVGTTPWHPLSLEFTTSAQTRLVRLAVWRPRSRAFPSQITGSFWVDEVLMKPRGNSKESAAAQAEP